MNRVVLTLGLLPWLVTPLSAQILVQDTTHHVTFRDFQFDLPGSDWAQITPSDQDPKPTNRVGFAKSEPLHHQELWVYDSVGDISLTPTELSARIFESTKQGFEKEGQVKTF